MSSKLNSGIRYAYMRVELPGECLQVKADMVLFADNTVWSITECIRCVCLDVLYKSTLPLPLDVYATTDILCFLRNNQQHEDETSSYPIGSRLVNVRFLFGLALLTGIVLPWTHNRVHTDIQVLFPGLSGLAKTKFQDFPGLKNPFFQDFPGNVPFKTLVARGQKVHIQNRLSVYLHYSKEAEMLIIFLMIGLTQEVTLY